MTITYELGDKLYVNITNACPNNCDFCIRNNGDGVGDAENLWLEREPTKKEIVADILSRDLSKYSELVFCGYGEPTCRLRDIQYVCHEIRKKSSIKIRMNTNGLSNLIHNRHTEKEFKNLVDSISISLNASNAQEYDRICHSKFGSNAFYAVLEFAEDVKKYVPEVILTIVDNNTPKEEIEACREKCNSIGVKFKVREYIK